MLVGTTVFVTVVIFGFTFHGLIAGFMLMAAGIGALRKAASHDPHFFAVYRQSLQYPRELPAVARRNLPSAPDLGSAPDLPRLPFVGYGARPRAR